MRGLLSTFLQKTTGRKDGKKWRFANVLQIRKHPLGGSGAPGTIGGAPPVVRGQIALWMMTKFRGRPGGHAVSPWREFSASDGRRLTIAKRVRLAPFHSDSQNNFKGRGRRTLKLGRGSIPSAVRGQIALWMMTKFAMVFFIIVLAVIMVSFSDTQKESICKTQAQTMAHNIAATLTNVINSPVEDERKVFALESSLSVGKVQLERYTINITNIPSDKNDQTGALVVHVQSASDCEGYAQSEYDRNMVLIDPKTLSSRWPASDTLSMNPSGLQTRDFYLIIAKCQPKVNGYPNYLYMRSCSGQLGLQVNVTKDCPPYLEDADPNPMTRLNNNHLLQCCGWEALETDPVTGVNTITRGKPLCA